MESKKDGLFDMDNLPHFFLGLLIDIQSDSLYLLESR